MKIIVSKENNAAKYAFNDGDTVVIGSIMTTVVDSFGKPVDVIHDMKAATANVITANLPLGETIKTFVGDKYLLIAGVYSVNPDYVAPINPMDEAIQ